MSKPSTRNGRRLHQGGMSRGHRRVPRRVQRRLPQALTFACRGPVPAALAGACDAIACA